MRASVFLLFSLCVCACAQREAAEPAPVAPVVVPAAPEDDQPVGAPPARAQADSDAAVGFKYDASASVEIRVDGDGGTVTMHSTPEAGVQVWGKFKRTDGGFRFSGGFSTRSPDAGRFRPPAVPPSSDAGSDSGP